MLENIIVLEKLMILIVLVQKKQHYKDISHKACKI